MNKKPNTITRIERDDAVRAVNLAFRTEDCFVENQLRENVNARHAFAFYIHKMRDTSCSYTGKMMGKDHATVLNSVKRHNDYYQTDKEYRAMFDRFMLELKPIKNTRWLCKETPFDLQLIKR